MAKRGVFVQRNPALCVNGLADRPGEPPCTIMWAVRGKRYGGAQELGSKIDFFDIVKMSTESLEGMA